MLFSSNSSSETCWYILWSLLDTLLGFWLPRPSMLSSSEMSSKLGRALETALARASRALFLPSRACFWKIRFDAVLIRMWGCFCSDSLTKLPIRFKSFFAFPLAFTDFSDLRTVAKSINHSISYSTHNLNETMFVTVTTNLSGNLLAKILHRAETRGYNVSQVAGRSTL